MTLAPLDGIGCRQCSPLLRRLLWAVALFALLAPPLNAEVWRSPLHSLTYVQVEKALRDPFLDAEAAAGLPASEVFRPLPPDVVEQLGSHAVDYDSFTATYLPPSAAQELAQIAAQHGLVVVSGIDRRVELPWHTFEAGDANGRVPPGFQGPPQAVRRLYLVQFAYPIREPWLASLPDCGVEPVAYFQQRTLLVRAQSERRLTACPAASYFSWIDSYRTFDRASAPILETESAEGWDLQFVPGTDLPGKARALPPGLQGEALDIPPTGDLPRPALLHAKGPAAALRAFVLADPDLLSVTTRGVGELSDERQGQIIAGNHNGTAPVLTPRYRDWLESRGLLGAANQQTVCVVDTGYDNGNNPAATGWQRHPDFATPTERLVAHTVLPNNDFTNWDKAGHGTMVAGIIAAEGGVSPPSPYAYTLADPDGFLYGSGVAPRSKFAFAKIDALRISLLDLQGEALDFCRSSATGGDLALIANESWNERIAPSGSCCYQPMNQYTASARFFDQRVLDGNGTLSGLQPMTIVFSAGNDGYDIGTNTVRRDSVASPALAKNVIAVGATTSYRPTPIPPLDCRPTPNGERPPDQDALHISRIAQFSGRGKFFSVSSAEKLHQVRVKPDLVAPGVRVFSTVPFMSNSYGVSGYVGCVKSYPPYVGSPSSSVYTPYTYGSGTSFSSPVVTGVAALARKWFLDRGVSAVSPSLIKAALLATADDLGPSGLTGNDPRPSPNYGWGRVNLNRLTDSAARFYVRDNEGLAVVTGTQRTWTRTLGNPTTATLIVLVWSDPAADVTGNSQAALKNNLGLAVDEVGGTRFWRGNNFQENVAGIDTGYSYRFSVGQSPLLDGINNVEAIFIPGNTFSAGQQLTIKVTGENVTTGTQKFAIYAYNLQLNQ